MKEGDKKCEPLKSHEKGGAQKREIMRRGETSGNMEG